MRRFYSPSARAGTDIQLETDESRHLRDVLRLNVGDDVAVFDGRGQEFFATIKSVGKKTSELSILAETDPSSPESPLDLTVAATIINGERYDLIIQKSVELGVSELIPLVSRRCEVKHSDAVKRLDRWRRIALEATKQCGRAKVMTISEPQTFDVFVNTPSPKIMFSEREGGKLPDQIEHDGITLVYGPKGGWDDSELKLAQENNAEIVTFGGRILRAETAAIAITAVIQNRFGDMN